MRSKLKTISDSLGPNSSLFGRYKCLEGARGAFWFVWVGEYRYIAKSAAEAILARQGLYRATILDRHLKGLLAMPKPIQVGATLSAEQLATLGIAIEANPAGQESGFWLSYNCCEWGPFKAPSEGVLHLIRTLQEDLADMEQAYQEADRENEGVMVGLVCSRCESYFEVEQYPGEQEDAGGELCPACYELIYGDTIGQ